MRQLDVDPGLVWIASVEGEWVCASGRDGLRQTRPKEAIGRVETCVVWYERSVCKRTGGLRLIPCLKASGCAWVSSPRFEKLGQP